MEAQLAGIKPVPAEVGEPFFPLSFSTWTPPTMNHKVFAERSEHSVWQLQVFCYVIVLIQPWYRPRWLYVFSPGRKLGAAQDTFTELQIPQLRFHQTIKEMVCVCLSIISWYWLVLVCYSGICDCISCALCRGSMRSETKSRLLTRLSQELITDLLVGTFGLFSLNKRDQRCLVIWLCLCVEVCCPACICVRQRKKRCNTQTAVQRKLPVSVTIVAWSLRLRQRLQRAAGGETSLLYLPSCAHLLPLISPSLLLFLSSPRAVSQWTPLFIWSSVAIALSLQVCERAHVGVTH